MLCTPPEGSFPTARQVNEKKERGEVTRREIEMPGETRFNVTSGHVQHTHTHTHKDPLKRASCKLNPANVNNVSVIIGGGNWLNNIQYKRM